MRNIDQNSKFYSILNSITIKEQYQNVIQKLTRSEYQKETTKLNQK